MLKKSKNIIMSALLILSLSACNEDIMHNLSELEVNRLLTKLQEVAIDASKIKQADGRWALQVKKSEVLRAIKYLNDTHTFREDNSLELDKPSLISSREDQRFRFERNLSREVENTLRNVSGVLEARVHLNLPLTDPLFGRALDTQPGSASVLLMTDGTVGVAKEEIARLVAGASGIKIDRITVVLSVKQNNQSDLEGSVTTLGTNQDDQKLPVNIRSDESGVLTLIRENRLLFVEVALGLIALGSLVLFILWRTSRRNIAFIRSL